MRARRSLRRRRASRPRAPATVVEVPAPGLRLRDPGVRRHADADPADPFSSAWPEPGLSAAATGCAIGAVATGIARMH